MAKKFFTPVDLTKNEIQNAVAQNLGSAPSSPVAGMFYYDTGTGRFIFRGASGWIDPTARANHSGTQLASTISDFDTQVRTSRLDQMAAPTADVSLNSHKLTNVTDGASAQDAATYGQLQAVLQGRDFKDSVRIATTASVTQSGLTAIDGITPVDGDRILDKDNSTASLRGIWVAHSGAWTRATDADTGAKLTSRTTVMVEEGTANGGRQYTLTTTGAIVVGTTSQTWAQTGVGTTYVQGTGVSISGATVAIDTSVTARHAQASIGDNSSTSIAVTHSFGTLDVLVQVFDNSSGATVECDVVRNSTSQVTLTFAVAPTTNQYRVVVVG